VEAVEATRIQIEPSYMLTRRGEDVSNAKKWRKKKMAKHKHRKRLKKTRWQRRQRNN
jgi:hypothetical protein